MTENEIVICLYALFWLIRINGCFRRNRQPLLRGAGWFFDVPVQSDFYSGAGRSLLLHYRLRMLIPFALDIPLAAYFILSGRAFYLYWLIIGLCALIHSPEGARRMLNAWFWISMVLTVVGTIWVEWMRKQQVAASLRVPPVRFPDFLNQSNLARWPLCFQPSAPTMILRGSRGYSLNLANTLTGLSAVYLAGTAVLIVTLRINR